MLLQPHHLPPLQNHSNSDVVSIDCNVKLSPNEEMNLHLRGNLWMKSLKAVSPPRADVWLLRNTPEEPSLGANLCDFFFFPLLQLFSLPGSLGMCGVTSFQPYLFQHREFNPKQSFLLQLTALTR